LKNSFLLTYHEEKVINFTNLLTLSLLSILHQYGCNRCSTIFTSAFDCELCIDPISQAISISAIDQAGNSRHVSTDVDDRPGGVKVLH
ncbi:hypothetical protein LINPERHAP2_LOCUS33491, partial [Linum perenne]